MELLYDQGVSNWHASWFRCSDPVSTFVECYLSWRVANLSATIRFRAVQTTVVFKDLHWKKKKWWAFKHSTLRPIERSRINKPWCGVMVEPCQKLVFFRCWYGRKGFIRPVLKHGPRSPASTRVLGWKTLARSESNSATCSLPSNNQLVVLRREYIYAPPSDQPSFF